MISSNKKFELFFGTGGVGKTTLAASRGFYLDSLGFKTLIITIDPSLRLKQILGLNDAEAGEICPVPESKQLSALLLSPSKTLTRAIKNQTKEQTLSNPILGSLSRQHGGLNEIMAVIELQYQSQNSSFDRIIVDTPPGKHFIDFLKATSRINSFFDKNFVEIFKYLGKPLKKAEQSLSKSFLSKIVSSGMKKLLSYLENVTGAQFVNLFIDTVLILYQNKEQFLNSLKFQEFLKDPKQANLFLVTAVDHNKILEANQMRDQVGQLSGQGQTLLINRSQRHELSNWEIPTNIDSKDLEELKLLKETLIDREQEILNYANENFTHHALFPEVIGEDFIYQIKELKNTWSQEEE